MKKLPPRSIRLLLASALAFPLLGFSTTSAFAGPLADAVDAPGLTFTTGGDADWMPQTTVVHGGASAAQSGVIGHNSESWIETTVTGPGDLTFWWKVSCEDGSDFLSFQVNSDYQEITGEDGWRQETFIIPAGTQTLHWSYYKDGSVVEGDDAGWLDQVVFTPAGPVSTGTASDITGTSATLNGAVDPQGFPTTATFQYGLTTAYGSSAAVTLTPPNGNGIQGVSAAISGLQPATRYHYRLVASNTSSPAPGADRTFDTPSDYYYNENGGEITITGYNGSATVLNIPATIIGLPVTGIAAYAFESDENITSVTIPTGVKTIGYNAFAYCSKLSALSLPATLESIDNEAFYSSALISVNIPAGVTSLGDGAFQDCSSLTSVTLPPGLSELPSYLFDGCEKLTTVTLPTGIGSIGYQAFKNCISLKSIIIPAGVTSIGSSAFSGCVSLTGMTLPAGISTISYSLFSDCINLVTVSLPSGATEIHDYAFYGCSALKSIIFPAGINYIGEEAFSGCEGLTSISLPAALETIESHAFSDCTGLTTVSIPAGVSYIGSGAFSGCNKLASIAVAATNAYYATSSGVLMNKALTTLLQCPAARTGTYAIPTSVNSISADAFSGCSRITAVSIPASIESIGDRAFAGCGLTSVTLGTNLYDLGYAVFRDCTMLTTATISGTITYLHEETFRNCGNLTTVTLPASIIGLEDSVFENCGRLAAINLPANLQYISSQAFLGCSSLTVVNIPRLVTFISSDAFQGCSGLTAINVNSLNTTYSSLSGALFDKARTRMIQMPAGTSGIFTIPSTVTQIGNSAFRYCGNLTEIIIPASVQEIGDSAFRYCRGLTSITIPGSVTYLASNAFGYCTKLASVTLPSGLTEIGRGAFTGCSSLKSITIPATVEYIGESAFAGSGLISAYFLGDAPYLDTDVFLPAGAGFKVYFLTSKSGFSTPAWRGYPALGASAFVPEIDVILTAPIADGGTAINFGSQSVASSGAAKTFTIRNSGTKDLTGISIAKNGAAAADFTVTGPAAKTLLPGASTTFKVTFKPSAKGTRTAAVHIASNDANESPFDIALTGTGTQPDIAVSSGSELTDGQSKVKFRSVVVKKSGDAVTLTIRNEGNATLSGISVAIDGSAAKDFKVKSLGANSLAAGASTTFKVTFKPKSKGKRKATIHIASNDPDENTFDIALIGKGKAAKKKTKTASSALAKIASSLSPGKKQVAGEDLAEKGTVIVDGLKYRTLTVVGPAAAASVEVSSNLIDWCSGASHTTLVASGHNSLTIRDNTPVTPENKRYIRMAKSR